MRILILTLLLPTLLFAQDLQFQFQPEAFPVEIDGWQPYCPWAGCSSESKPELCDIDGDGDLDFFVGEFLGYCEFYENIGNAVNPDYTFSSGHFDSIIVDARFNPCFGDLDGDGDYDLIFSDEHPHIWLYENVGDYTQYEFQLISGDLIPGPPWCRGPVLVDIDSDGDLDLFGGSWGNVSFFRNDGTPTDYDFTTVTGSFCNIDVGDKASPEFVDIDGDNDYDLFIGEEYGRIWFYQNDGDSANYDYTLISTNYGGIDVGDLSAPEFADIDGDGDYDLFVGKESDASNPMGDVFFYENVGDAYNPQFEFITTTYLSLDFAYFSAKPGFVDIDADLLIDLLLNAYYSFYYFENNGVVGEPSFILQDNNFQNLGGAFSFNDFADLDADGDYDMITGQSVIPGPPVISLYLNNGTPQAPQFELENPNFITNPDFFVNAYVRLADIDADQDYDLFVTTDDPYFFYYENVGSPQWPEYALITNQWQGISPWSAWRGFDFADLDGDGDLDMLIRRTDYQGVQLYVNRGTPQIPDMVLSAENVIFGTQSGPKTIDLVDIDDDADFDLFIGDTYGGLLFYRNTTGDTSIVGPRTRFHNYPIMDFVIGPNPANPVTWISYNLPYPQKAEIAVYNLLGQKVATLAVGLQMPGEHRLLWNAEGVSSGVYWVRLNMSGSGTTPTMKTERVVVVK